ncbi:hypothetical protein [Nitrososphaera sp.]|uniref:hypothetical protein n=1 Tax=Nitrososphaera sp. TaxID=1971748 RepID=UPI002EDA7B28
MDFKTRWLWMILIAMVIFSIALIVLRANIRTLGFLFAIGVAAATLWLYLDTRYFSGPKQVFSKAQPCSCAVCKHQDTEACLQKKCECCLVTKDEKVVGHSNNPLQ